MKLHTLVALPLLLSLAFADHGNSCDYSKTLSCCGTHVNLIINSYKTNNLYITINPAKRARDICCHMKHVEKCLLVESDCRPFYNTFVYNLYHNLQQHDVNCNYYKQNYCPGLQEPRQTEVTINLLGYGPKPQRPLIKYPEEATIVVNAISETVKTALENATQERATTIYADTVTEPGLVLDNYETTPVPELSFGEEILTDCDYDGTTPMPDELDVIQVEVSSPSQGSAQGSPDKPVLETPTRCRKLKVPEKVDVVPATPTPVSQQEPAKTDCKKTAGVETALEKPPVEDAAVTDATPNEVTDTSTEKAPESGGCGTNGEETAGSSEPVPTEPASNEENPSEPESSPSPVEPETTTDAGSSEQSAAITPGSGEQGKTGVESGEENPTNAGPGEQSPGNTESGEISPVNTESGEQSPVNTESGEKSPVNTESGEKGPVNTESGEQIPANTESGEKSPGNTESGEISPGNTESGEQSPANTESGDKSPINTESGEQSPSNTGSKEPIPANTESGEQIPTNAGSGEPSARSGGDTSAQEHPKDDQTQPAKETGQEGPSTACSSQTTEGRENGESSQDNVPTSDTKDHPKPCKDAEQAGTNEDIQTEPTDGDAHEVAGSKTALKAQPKPIEVQISREDKERACCLGTYLKPCTAVNSKCYQLFLALHSFLEKYDCLRCVNLEVVQDGCYHVEVHVAPSPKPEPEPADSSEEQETAKTRAPYIPKRLLVRPVIPSLPKINLPRVPQSPFQIHREKHARKHQQPIRKPQRKVYREESSEENEKD